MAIPGESEYIYGFHDPGDWRWILTEKGRTGWVLFTEEIGYDPNAHSGPDYREWSNAGFGVIVRLNNGYSPGGTIPHSRNYDKFAQRCANHVGDSKGAHIWIIGNEMNHANEQPGVKFEGSGFTAEELITPDKYAACFKKVRDKIKALPGHENDQVVLGAVAPYTAVFGYPGNESKSWVKYFTDILALLGTGLDGIALHTYTHGADPNLVFDEKQPWPQYPGLYYHFRAYRNFMKAIPAPLRRLPIYITETDQSDDGQGHILPWADTNSGWVRNAYKEINDWNSTPGNQQIRCLLLYRWGKYDDWYIEGKRGVIDDMKMAAEFGYKWGAAPVTGGKPFATASENLNVRKGPGTQFDRVGLLQKGSTLEVVGRNEDGTWLQLPFPDASNPGWVSAQFASVAGDLGSVGVLGAPKPPTPTPTPPTPTPTPPTPTLPAKPTATASDALNVRSGPGTQYQRLGTIKSGETYDIVGRSQDNIWLQIPYPNAGSRAWISAQFASVSGKLSSVAVVAAPTPPMPTPTSPQPPAPGKVTATTTDELNVRSGPGTNFNRVGGTRSGAAFDVTGRSQDNAWLQIPYPNAASRGWISAQFANVSGKLSSVAVVSAPTPPTPPTPPPDDQLVVGGYALSGDFLKFYRANTQITGAPISNVTVESGVQTQYFESLALQAASGGVRLAPIGRDLINARRIIADLQSRTTRPGTGSDLSPKTFGFDLRDVASTLPASSDKQWPRRPLTDIAYIVIHHTAAAGTVSPASLARLMVDKQDKPGIHYHFYITSDGTVYQTQPLDALTDHAVGQSRTSVGVALAGNFAGGALPTNAQLSSVGELCAWLMVQLNLSEARIRGMSEIIPSHQSPGSQWTTGANWKERLLAVTQAVLDSLRGRIPIALTVSVPRPEWADRTGSLLTYNKLPASQKKQGDSLNHPTRTLDAIRYLVVHHSGTDAATTVDQIASYQVITQLKNNTGQIVKEQWPGIGYHFYITAEGSIIKCNELTTVCYHVSGQNVAGVGVCFAGNFTTSPAPPNGVQLAAGGKLVAYLMDQLNLEFDAVKGHKELGSTDCPGQWTDGFAWRNMLMGTIGAQLTLSA